VPRLQSVFLAVPRIERDDGAGGDAEFGEQDLGRRDLVGFRGDVDMGKDEGGIGGECAQHLGGSAVVEIVKAAPQRLAIQRDAARPGCRACGLKPGGMATEDSLNRRRIEPLEDIADRGVRGRATPRQTKGGVQLAAIDVDKRDDAAIRVRAGHDGEDGEQQHMRQFVDLPLRPAWIRNVRQQAQQRREFGHGNLRYDCHPRNQTSAAS
jgi:hypothetical protein